MNKGGYLVDWLLTMVEVASTKVTPHVVAIKNLQTIANYNLNHIVIQCYDGASNMSGKFNGLQKLLRMIGAPNAIHVHCYAHWWNLVMVETTKSNVIINKFFATVHNVVVVITSSKKRQRFFTTTQIK